jgi:hypothetical protein
MDNAATSLVHGAVVVGEPNHRQELALERIDFAMGELASVLLSCCRSHDAAGAAIRNVRRAVAPVIADILAAD